MCWFPSISKVWKDSQLIQSVLKHSVFPPPANVVIAKYRILTSIIRSYGNCVALLCLLLQWILVDLILNMSNMKASYHYIWNIKTFVKDCWMLGINHVCRQITALWSEYVTWATKWGTVPAGGMRYKNVVLGKETREVRVHLSQLWGRCVMLVKYPISLSFKN